MTESGKPETSIQAERHLRAACYALLSFALALLAYYVFGFGRLQAIGYCATAFVVLNLLNRRAMFSRAQRVPNQEER